MTLSAIVRNKSHLDKPIVVINHFINLEISSGNPDDAVLTAFRKVTPNRRDNEKDSNTKGQSSAGGGSGRSQSNCGSNKRQGDIENAEPNSNKSETVKCTRCGYNAGASHTCGTTKQTTHTLALINQQSRCFRVQGVKQPLLKPTLKTDINLPGLDASIIPTITPPATKNNSGKGVTKTATKVCVPIVQTHIFFPL